MAAQIAVLDLETTGLYPNHGDCITEIAVAMISGSRIIGRWETLVDPERHIPSDVTALTGITDAMVRGKPKIDRALDRLFDFIGNAPIMAHNATFERNFLNSAMRRFGPDNEVDPLCSCLLSRRIFTPVRSHSLPALVSHFGLPATRSHRAMPDVEATVALLGRIRKEIRENGEHERELTSRDYHSISKEALKTFRENRLPKAIQLALGRRRPGPKPSVWISAAMVRNSSSGLNERQSVSSLPEPAAMPASMADQRLSATNTLKGPADCRNEAHQKQRSRPLWLAAAAAMGFLVLLKVWL